MKEDLRVLLADKLEPWERRLIYKSYDIVGDIAVIRVSEPLKERSKIIAEAVMQTHKRIKSVWRHASPVSGDFRLRGLEFVLGKRKTETFHREHGCVYKVDLEKCYFSPRLSYERMRIARQVQPDEVILNMFAGVGCYSIIIAKHSKSGKIFSIDINPFAIQYMQENIKLNKVEEKVVPVQEDAKKVIEERLQNVADRVPMPLPEKAYEYLDYALLALKPTGGWIHYYDFEHAKKGENPIEKIESKVSEKLQRLGVNFEVMFGRIVRTTGPNWYQVVLDIEVKEPC
ncbi:MAG: class I SAM-dependent methyltransferase family protein [Candidatus Bathyarchaeota archaeon]|nr:class I SAM-dependent methyltransferase family protein [Candidatus Bathyarchaeota archaeon]